jgi:hypothetical protein
MRPALSALREYGAVYVPPFGDIEFIVVTSADVAGATVRLVARGADVDIFARFVGELEGEGFGGHELSDDGEDAEDKGKGLHCQLWCLV